VEKKRQTMGDMNDKIIEMKAFIEKFDSMKKQNKLDLSLDQDLSFAVMNLVSIEEHLIFSGAKTEDTQYYNWVPQIREMRKKFMERLVKNKEGEMWCISKHLLATTMRLMEVGTKQQSLGQPKLAEEFFNHAYETYSLFWGLNLNLITKDQVKPEQLAMATDVQHNEPNNNQNTETEQLPAKQGMLKTLGALVKKAIDCCFE
jgi:hypothetical protein